MHPLPASTKVGDRAANVYSKLVHAPQSNLRINTFCRDISYEMTRDTGVIGDNEILEIRGAARLDGELNQRSDLRRVSRCELIGRSGEVDGDK